VLKTRQPEFPGELTLAFPGKERLNLAPVYVCQKTLVCLDCGHAEIAIPAPDWKNSGKGWANSNQRVKVLAELRGRFPLGRFDIVGWLGEAISFVALFPSSGRPVTCVRIALRLAVVFWS
jgi:hypothetical protein